MCRSRYCSSAQVVLTPHIASATVETRARMAELILENLDAFMSGAPLTAPVA
jgi:lactate dehydrogenase-like 2-hydroxyacid dehydrogenase